MALCFPDCGGSRGQARCVCDYVCSFSCLAALLPSPHSLSVVTEQRPCGQVVEQQPETAPRAAAAPVAPFTTAGPRCEYFSPLTSTKTAMRGLHASLDTGNVRDSPRKEVSRNAVMQKDTLPAAPAAPVPAFKSSQQLPAVTPSVQGSRSMAAPAQHTRKASEAFEKNELDEDWYVCVGGESTGGRVRCSCFHHVCVCVCVCGATAASGVCGG